MTKIPTVPVKRQGHPCELVTRRKTVVPKLISSDSYAPSHDDRDKEKKRRMGITQ
jgi:hypothetical protein